MRVPPQLGPLIPVTACHRHGPVGSAVRSVGLNRSTNQAAATNGLSAASGPSSRQPVFPPREGDGGAPVWPGGAAGVAMLAAPGCSDAASGGNDMVTVSLAASDRPSTSPDSTQSRGAQEPPIRVQTRQPRTTPYDGA